MCPNVNYYPGICVEQPRETAENIGVFSLSSGREWNSGTPEYEAGVQSHCESCECCQMKCEVLMAVKVLKKACL
jgi:hypothetical protein